MNSVGRKFGGPIRRSCNCANMQSSGKAQVGHASYFVVDVVVNVVVDVVVDVVVNVVVNVVVDVD